MTATSQLPRGLGPSPRVSRWSRIGLDALVVAVAVIGAYLVRFEGWPPPRYAAQLPWVAAVVLVVRLGLSSWARVDRRWWRRFTLADAVRLTATMATGSALLLAWRLVAPLTWPAAVVPLGVLVLEGLLALALSTGLRVAVRWRSEDPLDRLGPFAMPPARVRALEALLGREVQTMDARVTERLAPLRGARVLVTGAGGSIGTELCRQLVRHGVAQLVLVDHHEHSLFEIEAELRAQPCCCELVGRLLDVRDAAGVASLLAAHPPQWVFHAAAFKHVPMMESHPAAAVDNNVRGTRVLLEAAEAAAVEHLVLVSTDKAVAPSSVMGASKRVAELLVQSRTGRGGPTRACSVRFGNVLGSQGSVVHTFRRQIERGGPVTVTHPDATRFFMTIPEAARLVLQAAVRAKGGEVFMLDMGEPVRILDLAHQMIRLAGHTATEVPIEFIGLRPGEKLHEALVCPGEGIEPTGVEGIVLARPTPVEGLETGPWVARLEAAALRDDPSTIRGMLRAGVGYRPESSAQPAPDPAATTGDDAVVRAAG